MDDIAIPPPAPWWSAFFDEPDLGVCEDAGAAVDHDAQPAPAPEGGVEAEQQR